MNKTIGDVTSMPEELHKEVLKINTEAGLLRKQAEDIYINGTTPNKEALIKSINDKYTALQDKRTAIVNGETTIVDTLPLQQQDTLKREALNELTQEQNPDGKKNITIDDAQITERANNIYLKNKDAKSKENTTETKEQKVEDATPETQVESEKGVEDTLSSVVELNPENTNEAQTKGDTTTDANIQPGVETGSKQGKNKDTQPTVDPRASDTKTEIEKEYTVNDSEKAPKYKITFKEGVLDIKDSKGKTPSPPTQRKLLDKYANDFDFTNGKKSTIQTEAIDPVEHIAATSNNPAEIAETILNTNTKAYLEDNLDYSERIIAENIGKIDRDSFINFGDKNYINNNLARAYLKKGGVPIDTFIEELNEDFGTNLTEQDVIDFIVKNPNGPEDAYRAIRRDKIDPLKTAFTNKTGLPANAKFLNKAIKQQLAKNENFSVVDVFNDEQLISLLNEREQAEQETYTTRTNPSTRESSRQDENRPGVREKSEGDSEGNSDSKDLNKNEIDRVFKENSELSNIGTKKQYKEYLLSVFPNSKIQNILYRAGNFNSELIFTTPDYEYSKALYFGEVKVNSVLLDINNPYVITDIYNGEKDNPNNINNINDSIVVNIKGVRKVDPTNAEIYEVAVKDKKKIHVLASKQDIDGFKKFVNPKDNTNTEQASQASVKTLTNERIKPSKQKPTGTPKKLNTIIREVGDNLKSTLVYGKSSRRGVAGTYSPSNTLVKIKRAGDLDTVAHELGHLLDDRHDIVSKTKGGPNEIKLVKQLKWFSERGGSNPPSSLSAKRKADYLEREGLAEFIRGYIANPKETKAIAPELYSHFESNIDTKTKTILKEFSKDFLNFANASYGEQILSNVENSTLPDKEGFKTWLDQFKNEDGILNIHWLDKVKSNWTNSMHVANKAFAFVQDLKGNKVTNLKPEENFEVTSRLLGGINGKINNLLSNSTL
ncbi:hypothetical protein [Thalassobellus suaedae]|uniref:Large polyvalent protein-associated domain-containing protein n=1 Tax=Thalassobellus suaedae TaxID=3074124 RepID=A0ABY9XW48_9FLAO|nr:hypothetical protein RHP51_04810 [Flavobacteriaceae bacterium HL-DH14]